MDVKNKTILQGIFKKYRKSRQPVQDAGQANENVAKDGENDEPEVHGGEMIGVGRDAIPGSHHIAEAGYVKGRGDRVSSWHTCMHFCPLVHPLHVAWDAARIFPRLVACVTHDTHDCPHANALACFIREKPSPSVWGNISCSKQTFYRSAQRFRLKCFMLVTLKLT